MNIKRQILSGLLFLFGLSLLIMSIAAYNIKKLADDTKAILKNNYNTLLYSEHMLKALTEEDVELFDRFLELQQKNITEKGEHELTDSITATFKFLKSNIDSIPLIKSVQRHIYNVIELNMAVIEHRNTQAQQTTRTVFTYLLISGILFLVIAILFIVKFPPYIAAPVIKRDLDKTNLMATVSHELKTPIASIKLSTALLSNERIGSLNLEQKQLINNIKEDTERVLKITEAVLNMAQMESGKIQLNIQAIEPHKIINYAIETVKLQAEQKNILLETHCNVDLPRVNADIEKTAWVMVNLLSNAIRYSNVESKIIIEAKASHETILFSVKDFGEGIIEAYQEKIFERYFQVPGKGKNGNGLGLAISKEFIEAQSGKIWVESEPGLGSKFCFELKHDFINDITI